MSVLSMSRRLPFLARSFSTKIKDNSFAGTARQDVDFGFKRVAAERKAELVSGVFSSVADSYNLMNDLMSVGVHRLWKRTLVDRIAPVHDTRLIDVAGGTGDIAIRFLKRVREVHGSLGSAYVKVVDANENMVAECFRCMSRQGFISKVSDNSNAEVELGDAEALDNIKDESFDAYTIAFGIRNCTNIDNVLTDAYRVLRPGGRLLILEFGKVSNPLLSRLYSTYSFRVIPHIGHIVAGDREAYQYLVESIERFPSQSELAERVRAAGFTLRGNGYEDLTFGVATIWTGWKS